MKTEWKWAYTRWMPVDELTSPFPKVEYLQLQTLYQDLKTQKIQDLEGLLEEQVWGGVWDGVPA